MLMWFFLLSDSEVDMYIRKVKVPVRFVCTVETPWPDAKTLYVLVKQESY